MESPTEAEFRDFVVARRHRMLRTAFLLTGDEARAKKLLGMAFARVRRHWRRITRDEDPETYLLRELVRAHASRWRQWISRGQEMLGRQAGRQPAGGTAEDGALPEDSAFSENGALPEDAIPGEGTPGGPREVLQYLPPRTRAVLILRHYEELAEDDVAYLTGCSLETVGREERRGLDRLEAALPAESSDDTVGGTGT